jgi:hypothetical protein
MRELHIHPELMGKTLLNARGDKHTIVAAWLAEGVRGPYFQVLIVGRFGECFKQTLPDIDWTFEPEGEDKS